MKSNGIIVKVNNKIVGCLNDLGSIKQTREKNEKKCPFEDRVRNVLGVITTDDIPMAVAYDPADTAGAGEMESVFNSGSTCTFSVELPDTAGTNGTTFTWADAVITEFEVVPNDDGEVGAKFTMAPGAKPTVTAAA